MKKILTLILTCLFATQIIAQEKNINAFISYGTFNVTDENASPYLETYISFDCSSLVYVKGSDGQYDASINLTIIFKQGESIKNYDKYTVTSPKVSDTTDIKGFFMDIQRYSLANGEYQMEITIEDANNKSERPFRVSETIIIDFPENICFSSIIALEDLKPTEKESVNSKNGYDLSVNERCQIVSNLQGVKFCVFLDKDKYLGKMLEKSGLRLFTIRIWHMKTKENN